MAHLLDLWLDTGTAGIILLPFAVLYVLAAAITWLTFFSPARPCFAKCVGVVGPQFMSVAILFSLFAAFLANDVWRQTERARAAVDREANGIRTIMRLADAIGEAGMPLRSAAFQYADAIISAEWPAMRQGVEADAGTAALQRLALVAVSPELGAATSAVLHEVVINAFIEIREARRARIYISNHHVATISWFGMIILGVLTQIGVAVVHLERLYPQTLAQWTFTTAFAATVALIGANERPFSGVPIDDAPLRAAMALAKP